jgi:hypothetical protein
MECSHGTCTHLFWTAPRDASVEARQVLVRSNRQRKPVAPVAAGTNQASTKDEDLGRTVIGTVKLAA